MKGVDIPVGTKANPSVTEAEAYKTLGKFLKENVKNNSWDYKGTMIKNQAD